MRRSCSASRWITPLMLLLICSSATPISGQETETFMDDLLAIKSMRKAFSMYTWAGDPCFPFAWPGLQCDVAAARVVAIDLRSRGLNGFIPTTIKSLTALKFLDLSNNKFNGTVPEELGLLPSLATLALDNNNFCGWIPQPLLNRSSFSFSGNPLLCRPGDPCDSAARCITYPDPPAFTKEAKKSAGLNLVIGAIIGGCIVAGIIGGLFVCFYVRSQRKKKSLTLLPETCKEIEAKQSRDKASYHSSSRPHHSSAASRSDDILNVILSPFRRSWDAQTKTVTLSQAAGYIPRADIVTATQNFATKIGEGGYGPVYKGTLSNGKAVAVKVNKINSQGTEEFANEVGLLTRIHHRNLVSLLGFCEDGDERFLLYEFQEKGALNNLLWGPESEKNPLDWKTRLDIALNAAKGLEYLHTGCDPKVIHRDVKSSNILVDDKFVAKVADFGISKATPEGGSISAYSARVRGTPGYVDPEYLITQRFSSKSDVYSFGVVLMEIIAGCRPQATLQDGTRFQIVDLFTEVLSTGDIFGVADTALEKKFNPESMWRVADLAFSSVDKEGAKRPDMSHIVKGLAEAIELENSYDPAAPPPTRSWSRAVTLKLPR
ncbi:hypothetical protein R1flu_012799 [Riccia fluitans]|uniref:Protein kinase domain-containing protein n=1 Tax=Riccia fluitans TaxID=41844 RepID=A0ABD1ZFQ6_9MARC